MNLVVIGLLCLGGGIVIGFLGAVTQSETLETLSFFVGTLGLGLETVYLFQTPAYGHISVFGAGLLQFWSLAITGIFVVSLLARLLRRSVARRRLH